MMRALAISEAFALCARLLPKSQANAVAEAEGTITAQPPEAETVSRVAPGRTGDGVAEAGAAHSLASDAGSQADEAAGGVTVGGDESGTAASLSPSPAIPPVVAVRAPSTAQGSTQARSGSGSSLPLSNRAGLIRPVAPMAAVSDGRRRLPHSRRPCGASVVGRVPAPVDRPLMGVTQDCRGLRASALLNSHRHGRALPSAPVRERDGCAPVPTGCATVASLLAAASGSPAGDRLSLRARFSLPAHGGRALVPCLASPMRFTGSP